MSFREELTRAREERGVSRHDLALALGWRSSERISRLEAGEQYPDRDLAGRIELALGLETGRLVSLVRDRSWAGKGWRGSGRRALPRRGG